MFPRSFFTKVHFNQNYFQPVEAIPSRVATSGGGGGNSGYVKPVKKKKWHKDDEDILLTVW